MNEAPATPKPTGLYIQTESVVQTSVNYLRLLRLESEVMRIFLGL